MIFGRQWTACAIFAAMTIPFGIAVHLLAELAALGLHDDARLIFSARHEYLAVLALLSLAILHAAARSVAHNDRRRIAAQLVAALPYRGQGSRFFFLSFAGQFGFFGLTQFGEGDPLSTGDLGIGISAALLASMIGAFVLSLRKTELLRTVIELFFLLDILGEKSANVCSRSFFDTHLLVRRPRSFTQTVSSRPPPYVA